MAIDVLPSGQLAVKDSLNHRVATMGPSIRTGRWIRIEWRVDQVDGQIEVRLFNASDLSTPTGRAITPTDQRIGPNTDKVQIGRSGTQPFSSGFWTDDPAISRARYLGPA